MDFTLKRPDVFPAGTNVSAYPRSNWGSNQDLSGAPVGAAAAGPVAADANQVAFTGLNANTEYVAVGQVGGVYRYINFVTAGAVDSRYPLFGNITDTQVPVWDAASNKFVGADKAQALKPTTVKNGAYAVQAGDFVPVDCSGGNVVLTLPNAPADRTRVAIKLIAVTGTNAVTINCAGADVFNKAGGSTSGSLSLLNQAITLQYAAASGIWYVQADDLPLSQLDGRYLALSGTYAARPAANAVPAGTFYWATNKNGGTMYRSTGAAWKAVAVSGQRNGQNGIVAPTSRGWSTGNNLGVSNTFRASLLVPDRDITVVKIGFGVRALDAGDLAVDVSIHDATGARLNHQSSTGVTTSTGVKSPPVPATDLEACVPYYLGIAAPTGALAIEGASFGDATSASLLGAAVGNIECGSTGGRATTPTDFTGFGVTSSGPVLVALES